MEESCIRELAESWLAELEQAKTRPDGFVSDVSSGTFQLERLVYEEPEDAWRVMKAILECSTDDWAAENLGAGDFETLLENLTVPVESFFSPDDERAFRRLYSYVWASAFPIAKKDQIARFLKAN